MDIVPDETGEGGVDGAVLGHARQARETRPGDLGDEVSAVVGFVDHTRTRAGKCGFDAEADVIGGHGPSNYIRPLTSGPPTG